MTLLIFIQENCIIPSGTIKKEWLILLKRECDNNLLSCVHSLLVDLPEMGVFHLKSAQHALAYFSHTLSMSACACILLTRSEHASMHSLTSHAFSICLSYRSVHNLRISLNLYPHHHNTMILYQLCTSMQLEEFSWQKIYL